MISARSSERRIGITPKVLRILVVEDEEDSRELMQRMLRTTGQHDIAAVATAEEALEQLRSERFDLVVTDIGLPGATGIEMLDDARRENLLAGADVIVCSANQREGGRVRARGDRFIPKPADTQIIVDSVRAVRARVDGGRRAEE
jgi:CheY-like chemotaxis protein